MSSFDDLLEDVNERMGWDVKCGDDDNDDLKFEFQAKPKKGCDIEVEKTWQGDEQGTKTKIEVEDMGVDWKWVLSNDKFQCKGKTPLMDADGYKLDLSFGLESAYLDATKTLLGKLSFETPDLGGIKLNTSCKVKKEWEGEGTKLTLRPKINAEVSEEINVGVSAEHDGSGFTQTLLQAVYARKTGGLLWMRGDLMKKMFSGGCDNKLNDSTKHSFEAVGHLGEGKGIAGTPLEIRSGVEYDLSDKVELKCRGRFAENIELGQTTEWEVTDNWKLEATQSFDSGKIASKNPYHIGFGVTYKL